MKPATYELKTDWFNDTLMVCKTCVHYDDFKEFPGNESCIHPEHLWQGSYADGPEWNGFCMQWEPKE